MSPLVAAKTSLHVSNPKIIQIILTNQMTFSGDISSLNTIYVSAINNYSKFVKEINLHLVGIFSEITSKRFAANCPYLAATTKSPLKTFFRHKILMVTF